MRLVGRCFLFVAAVAATAGAYIVLVSDRDARAQIAKETPVSPGGEEKIEASRRRGSTPKEGADVPIGVTGFTLDEP